MSIESEDFDSNNCSLTANGRKHCLWTRWLFHKVNLLPLAVNVQQGKFLMERSRMKLALCLATYVHFFGRTLYANLHVGHGLLTGQYGKASPHLLVWDVMTMISGNMYSFWYPVYFLMKPDVTVNLLDQVFVSNKGHSSGKTLYKFVELFYLW